MTSALRTLAAIEPRVLDGTLTYESALALRAVLLQRYAPRTTNRLLSAARGVLRAAINLGLRSEHERVFSALRAIKSFQLPKGRLLENAEVAALARACQDGTLSGIRDAALLGVLLCGLRRSEVVALRTSDYDAEQGRLIVRGKGRKERDVYLPQAVQRALNAWLQWRVGDGSLFTPIKFNVIVNARLSAQSVYNVLLKRATQAGVWNVSPHDLRRTFVSRLLESGAVRHDAVQDFYELGTSDGERLWLAALRQVIAAPRRLLELTADRVVCLAQTQRPQRQRNLGGLVALVSGSNDCLPAALLHGRGEARQIRFELREGQVLALPVVCRVYFRHIQHARHRHGHPELSQPI